jgi:hypothetical protein
MTDETSFNPHKEEDEGYLAAESGQHLSGNPYPRGTIRYEEWRRGWHHKNNEIKKQEGEGYLAAEAGQSLTANPYPKGTIRFADWRRGWQTKSDERRRAVRLGRA